MDSCLTVDTPYDKADVNGSTCLDNPWTVGSKDLRFDRVITAVEGNRITVDAPIVNALEKEFGGGSVYKYTADGRISQVGVENMRGDSEFVRPTTRCTAGTSSRSATPPTPGSATSPPVHFGYAAVTVVGNSKWVTVQDSTSIEPVSMITGGRRYTWNVDDSQMVLFQRCTATTGRHDFVQGSNVPGPNVFLAGTAIDARDDIGPHHRWSAGGLYDGIVTSRSIRDPQPRQLRHRPRLGGGQHRGLELEGAHDPGAEPARRPELGHRLRERPDGRRHLGRGGHAGHAEEPLPAAAGRPAGPRSGAGHLAMILGTLEGSRTPRALAPASKLASAYAISLRKSGGPPI